MERYWVTWVDLVFALKEDAIFSLLVVHVVKSEALEGVPVVDVEITFSSDPKEKAHASVDASVAGLVLSFSRYA